MKRNVTYILIAATLAICGCNKELAVWDEEVDKLSFVYPMPVYLDATVRYSFVYYPETVKSDTIWLEVETMGEITDYDRKVSFRQAPSAEGEYQAQPGVHYVPFDDPELSSKFYFVKAGENKASIPLVVLRDGSLQENEASLLVEIAKNEYFDIGYLQTSTRQVYFADILTQPSQWNSDLSYFMFGDYGRKKHQFIMSYCLAPLGQILDDEWFDSQNLKKDRSLTAFWASYFTRCLIEYNEQRLAEGLDYLREDPTDKYPEGQIVQFRLNGVYQPYI